LVEEHLSDIERRTLIDLCMRARCRARQDDAELAAALTGLIAKLSGTHTVVVAQRTYPSQSR
jgi:hypothetical protein